MSICMCGQRITCSESLSTKTTGNRDSGNMVCLNVAHYIHIASFLSAHLAYSSFSLPFPLLVDITIFDLTC